MDITHVTTLPDLEDYQALKAYAFDHDYVGLPADPIEELLPNLTKPHSAGEHTEMYVGRVGGETVGILHFHYPTLDNLEITGVEVVVHPDRRRQGHGRVLTEFAIARTRELGRSRIFAEAAFWPDRPPLAQGLFDRYGFSIKLEDVRRMLDLHVHPPQPRCPVPDGYRIVQWLDRCPDELVDGCAYLMGRMTIDSPMGEMDYEQEKWDAARYRDKEESAMSRNRLRVASAAVHESGQVAGISDIGVNRKVPEIAYQWDTIVDPDHRGHGLGLVLKTWNHALLAESVDGIHYLNTWNAASNSFMIRVNELMGYEPIESWGEFQLDL